MDINGKPILRVRKRGEATIVRPDFLSDYFPVPMERAPPADNRGVLCTHVTFGGIAVC